MNPHPKILFWKGCGRPCHVWRGDCARGAQLVYKSTDWNIAEFDRLIKNRAHVKQLFDETQIGGGRFLNNIKNSLNGLQFGFNIPADQIKIVSAMHGPGKHAQF